VSLISLCSRVITGSSFLIFRIPSLALIQSLDLLVHIDVNNEELGKRRADGDDEALRIKLRRFSLRRKVIPSNEILSTSPDENASASDSPRKSIVKKEKEMRDLAAAFRILAATRSADKEGFNFGAAAIRDDASVTAMSTARSIESKVVELIRSIGEVVVNAEQPQGNSSRSGSVSHTRTDPVFEYFCEKSILTLLVDIAKEKRYNNSRSSPTGRSYFHGVVWSPLVKAQVLRTVSVLISDVRNHPVLYYLLSNNSVNELIQCMLPLQQWTDPALEKMMPAYVELLKNGARQLSSDPHLFPFLTSQDPASGASYFPLFSAALDTATSPYACSDSFVYGTSVNVGVNIMQIPYPPIRSWISDAATEQGRLADHLCHGLLQRYLRITNLTTGPVVDGVRSNAISGQLACLHDQLLLMNEVFWSGIKGMDVRLCESLLRKIVSVLLNNLLPTDGRQFLGVGVVDADVIPAKEALAQVSAVVLSQLFSALDYVPFQRMLGVAILHPQSTSLWSSLDNNSASPDTYIIMPALNKIVAGKNTSETLANPFRSEIIKTLRGDHGEWRIIATAILLESALKSRAMDGETLQLLEMIPRFTSHDYTPTSIEEAVASFLERPHDQPSPISIRALECVGSLALRMVYQAAMIATDDGKNYEKFQRLMPVSPICIGLTRARRFFSSQALKSQEATGVADIFLDLLEAAITSRYTAHLDGDETATFTCLLSRRGCGDNISSSEVLVRKFRGVSRNDVEEARFYINMVLHFRSLCKVVVRLGRSIQTSKLASKSTIPVSPARKVERKITLDLVDKADEISRTVGGLMDKPVIGTDLDLSGRMTFRFFSAIKGADAAPLPATNDPYPNLGGRERTFSEEKGIFRPTSKLVLVLDPNDMFVVKPFTAQIGNRGTVLASISLRRVIAAAADGDWLHVAVRHDDVGFLIKNGNMALKFESGGTCLIVKQYLDRSREVLRQELMGKISSLFGDSKSDVPIRMKNIALYDDVEIPKNLSYATV
jgi:hypothetical protein